MCDFVCWGLIMMYVTILQHFIEHCSHHLRGKWARPKLYCNRWSDVLSWQGIW